MNSKIIFLFVAIFSICVDLLWDIILGEKRMLLKFFCAHLDKYSTNKGFLFNVENMTGWFFQPFKTGCLVLACKKCATDWRLSGAELCGVRQVST